MDKFLLYLQFVLKILALESCNFSKKLLKIFSPKFVGMRRRGETGHLLGNTVSVGAFNRKRGPLNY